LGPVFRAYDAQRERLVAVKLFTLDLPPEKVHQLVAELELLVAADLTHPAMAAPLATGMTGVTAYLAQDYVAAESLDLVVREYGPAPPIDAVRVAAQLAGALDFAAVANFSHSALHPRDVLLSTDETRLTGVGVAQALEKVGVTAPIRRPYSPPERMTSSAWDRRADIFSLAALVHELMWGRRIAGPGPHAIEGLTEIAGAHLAALQAVFGQALAEDPADRFETAMEFAEGLKAAFPDLALTQPGGRKKRSVTPAPVAEVEPRLPLEGETHDVVTTVAETTEADTMQADTMQADTTEADAVIAVSGFRRTAADAAEPALHDDAGFDLDRLNLRVAEPEPEPERYKPERYKEVVEVPAAPVIIAAPPEPMSLPLTEPAPISVLEQSRSAVWPLMASLVIGLSVGFAGGYGVGSRDRTTAAAVATPGQAPPVGVLPPTGREATEVAVAPPAPKPEVPPATGQVRLNPDTPPPAASVRLRPDTTSAAPKPARRAAVTKPVAPKPVAPAIGKLSVESRPAGAHVFVDGKAVGTTPLALPSVAVGDHAIRLERDGYRTWSSSIKVVTTELNRVTASLER
jgi:serine/threonine-protein kinase